MEWTTQARMEPGYYWWRAHDQDQTPEVVQVRPNGRVLKMGSSHVRQPRMMRGLWSGPIAPPGSAPEPEPTPEPTPTPGVTS